MAAPVAKRIKTLSVSRPIVYGNTAKKMGDQKPPNAPVEHTHLWTIFVRAPQNEDVSYYIKQVVFKLHETYPNNTRVVNAPPFELTETGWGEFDVNIKINFADVANEKPLSLYHRLRLHPYDSPGNHITSGTDEKGDHIIKASFFDEIVFNEPNEQFFQVLMTKPGNLLPPNKSDQCVFSRQLEQEEIDRMDIALKDVDKQIYKLEQEINDKK
ncbi:YEATS domain-containing protein YAF9 KNAG_0H03440 [Huiozyma naganishii CBS 8797]|uniref:Protein AF-9 homolog n=1 Tax=Huiozyma naganishii (strain ATCC MYA-139 / BCRC 22969 / CBS 8797 / KCTC 17520 / NBRC 10181 / NCYC 3082 / Yp74L-3) TaxID=1071383 RepID=J7RPT7_HUIN7|nr:hypothetical protein KNAG_0H03440 [Kazachstania naganishii CBS 8797]CCK71758.1 hypothetical protein KNAG_0H03440 [Kazachstania naganishii CBS 8797]